MKIVYLQYGGKSSMAKWIVSHFPEHRVYLEPFCGSCSVLLAKPKSAVEIVNDLDSRLISMFETLRERPEELAAVLWATPYSPENWRKAKTSEEALEDARLLVASGKQFFCGNGRTSTWGIDKSTGAKPRAWAEWCNRVLPFAARIKDVQILCEDAIKAIERVKDNPDALIYVDPPYLGHEKEYRFQVDYSRLVEVLSGCKAKVIISEYEPAIERFQGWNVVRREYFSTGGRRGVSDAKTKTECLIANFPLPVQSAGTTSDSTQIPGGLGDSAPSARNVSAR